MHDKILLAQTTADYQLWSLHIEVLLLFHAAQNATFCRESQLCIQPLVANTKHYCHQKLATSRVCFSAISVLPVPERIGFVHAGVGCMHTLGPRGACEFCAKCILDAPNFNFWTEKVRKFGCGMVTYRAIVLVTIRCPSGGNVHPKIHFAQPHVPHMHKTVVVFYPSTQNRCLVVSCLHKTKPCCCQPAQTFLLCAARPNGGWS